MANSKPNVHQNSDSEIDRREFNGHTIVLLEDRKKSMLKADGTSYQYIIAVERTSAGGHSYLAHERYITDLMKKKGYANAKAGAQAIFMDPESFRSILGDHWLGFKVRDQAKSDSQKALDKYRKAG